MICTQKQMERRAVIDPNASWQFCGGTTRREGSGHGRYAVEADFVHVKSASHAIVSYWLPDTDGAGAAANAFKAYCQIVNSGIAPNLFWGALMPIPGLPYERDILVQCLASTEEICHDRRCLEGVCEKHAVMCEDCGELFHVGCTEIFDGVHLCRECLSVASPYVSSPRMGGTRVA